MMLFDEMGCVVCGIIYGLPRGYADNRRKDTRTFYCPNGHQMSWKETEADKLRRERDRLKQDIARAEDETRRERDRADAAERREARMKKRASAGVCPCCNRTFQQLARHMKAQHPTFNADPTNVVTIKRTKNRSA